jgi:hypothetical protein
VTCRAGERVIKEPAHGCRNGLDVASLQSVEQAPMNQSGDIGIADLVRHDILINTDDGERAARIAYADCSAGDTTGCCLSRPLLKDLVRCASNIS